MLVSLKNKGQAKTKLHSQADATTCTQAGSTLAPPPPPSRPCHTPNLFSPPGAAFLQSPLALCHTIDIPLN